MNIPFNLKDGSTIHLQADAGNFMLARPRIRTDKATGEASTELEPFSYHATIENALQKVFTLRLRMSDASCLKELKDEIDQTRKELKTTWGTPL